MPAGAPRPHTLRRTAGLTGCHRLATPGYHALVLTADGSIPRCCHTPADRGWSDRGATSGVGAALGSGMPARPTAPAPPRAPSDAGGKFLSNLSNPPPAALPEPPPSTPDAAGRPLGDLPPAPTPAPPPAVGRMLPSVGRVLPSVGRMLPSVGRMLPSPPGEQCLAAGPSGGAAPGG
jgi:hypothetical protein